MKRILYTFLMGLICAFTAIGQPYDLTLNTAEIGTQLHQATNSITFVAGYSYYPNGGTMLAEIVNAYLTGSVSYNQTVVDPASRSLNTFPYLVGSTKGAFDVNAGGGASYAIPIDLLPGVNGLAPSLSLVYSSNSGPGVAGYGWQIGGISAIGRTGKTIYNDGTATGVDLTSNDRFILDGQRLVLTSGSYGADQGTYRTEIDEFSRIQSQSTSGSGPGKFMVQTKSGLKNLYGSNDDGCQRINGNSEVLNWYLTETSDLYGNLISYKYMRNNYMVYPAEISYGPNKITFTYKLRTDVTISYLKGQKIEQHLLLDKITVAYNNNVVKTYELKYNYLSNSYFGYSVLNEVIEFGTSGSRLNSTAFTYQAPENAAFGGLSTLIIPQSDISANSILFPGDFNGDGYKDLLTLDKSTQTITKIYLNNKKGSFNLSDTKIAAKPIGDIVITDLNGDNVDDFIIIGRPIDSNGILIYYWMLCNGAKFGIPHEFANKTSEYKEVFDDINNRSSDFDGDGFEDFLVITKNSSAWEMYSFTPSTVNTTFLLNNRSGTVPSWGDKVYLADFNGDGKTDIWSFDITGLKIYALSGVSLIQIYSSNYPDKDHCFEMGDFQRFSPKIIFL
ncbi:MAG: FG-GAP-like repeat-containing protein [Bacteroidota bacterium]|nr:FG-GAP-like repeat-containing protein [Bacteroidota bacterium]